MGKEDRRRHFSREFKRDAVQLVTEKGDAGRQAGPRA
jgi:transposase-like protein